MTILITGCAGARAQPGVAQANHNAQVADAPTPFEGLSSVDPNVPTPEAILGHPLGEGAVRYEPMVRYLKTLAESSPFVTLTPYAVSHEGRTLYYLTVTGERNHKRLDDIRAAHAKLADPRKLTEGDDPEAMIETLPGIAWLAYGIHGDELSSVDAALLVAYRLAAGTDDETRRLRDELIVHIDPCMNPDGRERYLAQLQHLSGKVPSDDYQALQHSGLWSAGRGNHYLFDLNRDWLMQVHPETRGRAAAIIEWNPHLVVDSHEMGPLETYLFDPPREPWNNNLTETNLRWRRRFSADQARAFDRHGWSYYTREWYDEWYPGYTNAWCNLQSAIGLLYEQAGVDGTSVKQEAGNVLTYRESVHHHYVSSLANLRTLREHRVEIIRDFFADRKAAVAPGRTDEEYFLLPPPADRALFRRFADLLRRQGIEIGFARAGLTASNVLDQRGRRQGARAFPAGTLIVSAAQPRRRLIRALLEFDPRMSDSFLKDERTDLEKHRGTRSYDVSAWNLSMAYGLEAYWAKHVSAVDTSDEVPSPKTEAPSAARYGYLIDGASHDVYRATARLLAAGLKVRVATERFSIAGRHHFPGTLLLRNNENPADARERLVRAADGLDVDLRGVDTALCESGPDLGGQRFVLLDRPRVALVSQWPVATTSFGSVWHLLDARVGLQTSPISITALGSADLRRYNVIILPHVWRTDVLPALLNQPVRRRLKQWMESGGTLIAIGGSAAFLARKDTDFSAVRLRREALDELEIYEEARQREQQAAHVEIDPARIWDGSEASNPKHDDHKHADDPAETPPADLDARKREDTWLRIFQPTGAIVDAVLDPEHWLTFGLSEGRAYENRLPVLLSGSYAFLSKYPVQTPVRLAEKKELRLSGLLWPEARKRWAGTAYATVERVGYGQLVLFAGDPIFRGYFEGTGRLLLNAVLLGPGMADASPIPW